MFKIQNKLDVVFFIQWIIKKKTCLIQYLNQVTVYLKVSLLQSTLDNIILHILHLSTE